MKLSDLSNMIPSKSLIEVGAAALDTPLTANLVGLTSVTTKGDRDDAAEMFVAALKSLRSKSAGVTETRQVAAIADWQLRLTCDRRCPDGVTRPDYNGKTPLYKRLRDDALRMAGLDITSKTTPFEGESIKAARDTYLSIVRYEVRKIADAVLSVEDLVASGFKHSKQLPSDQKLAEPPKTERKVPVDQRLADVQAALADLLSRKAEVRQVDVVERIKLAKRIEQQSAALVNLLRPTAAENARIAAQGVAQAGVTSNAPQVKVS